jgi:hypothetical protein
VEWRWFCSRSCAGRWSGERNNETGLLARHLFPAAEGRRARIEQQRQALFVEEATALQRYGVPRSLTVAILDRVFRLGHKRGYDVMRRRILLKGAA